MKMERNYLLEKIYPQLQDYCSSLKNSIAVQYSLEFQVVDMRWGVRDEALLDHSGPKTCMDELRSCQKVSLGPNFVVSGSYLVCKRWYVKSVLLGNLYQTKISEVDSASNFLVHARWASLNAPTRHIVQPAIQPEDTWYNL